jgi:hypothetical protein
MKSFQIPPDCDVAATINEAGKLGFGEFVQRFVLVRPAFRELANLEHTLEIANKACASAGTEAKLTNDAHALLARELAFPGVELNWQLVIPVAKFQQAVQAAKVCSEAPA